MATVAPRHDLFAAGQGGPARAIGGALAAHRPVIAAVLAWALAFVALGAVIIGLGLLLTHVLLPAGLGAEDASWSRWFVQERTPTLDTMTGIASDLGSSGVILTLSVIAGVALIVGRYWRQFVFLLFALTLEFGVFLVTTMIVDRHRPTVPQLDAAPPTSSFPSGHTASALTLYLGVAIVLTSLVRGTRMRALVWVLAILPPVGVAISRLYRGMHFPTDVAASVLLSVAALLLGLLAVRSMAAAATERNRRVVAPPPADSPPEVAA